MKLRSVRLSAIALVFMAFAGAQRLNAVNFVITPILLEGDTVPSVGAVTIINNLAVGNNGAWLVEADTNNIDTDADEVVMKGTGPNPSRLFLQEGQSLTLPAGTTIDSFDSLTVNASGNGAFNFFLGGATGSTDSGVFHNANLVIQESTLSAAAGFSPNTPYIGWFEVKFNDNNQILMVASIDDPAITSTVDRALVIVNNPTGAYTETLLAKEGDVLDGETIADFGTGPHNIAFNNLGHTLFQLDGAGATATDGILYLHDGTTSVLKAREGSPSGAIAGRNWLTVLGSSIDLNNIDDWVIRSALDGDTADNVLIVKNGSTVIAREGSSLPAIGGLFTFTAFGTGAIAIADNGDVVWTGDWNDPDTTRDTGLFLNDQLIVQKGVTQIGGNTIESISLVQDNFQISRDGRWIVFEGALAGGIAGAFLVEITAPTGDMNCDTVVNGKDVTAFSLAVLDPTAYGIAYPGCPILNGDFSGNSVTDAADIPGMVDALLNAI